MRSILVSAAVCVTLAGFAPSASAATITLDAFSRSYLQPDGNANEGGSGSNYLAGRGGSLVDEARNFFFFDLTGITDVIVSASVVLQTALSGSSDGSETYTLFDVSTPLDTLLTSSGGNAAFNDLGSGKSYASRLFDGSDSYGALITFALNADAIADLQSAAGGQFGIGGAITTLSASGEQYLFGGTNSLHRSQLVLETQPALTAVPEPATLTLLGAGLVALARQRRRAGGR